MIGLMDLTSHPEISGSTNTTHGHAQRGTGSLLQATSMLCVCCSRGTGHEAQQGRARWSPSAPGYPLASGGLTLRLRGER